MMKWTIVIMWFQAGAEFEAPNVGHGYHWFDTEQQCEQHMLKEISIVKDFKAYRDQHGLVVEAPWLEGTFYQRCQLFSLPSTK